MLPLYKWQKLNRFGVGPCALILSLVSPSYARIIIQVKEVNKMCISNYFKAVTLPKGNCYDK